MLIDKQIFFIWAPFFFVFVSIIAIFWMPGLLIIINSRLNWVLKYTLSPIISLLINGLMIIILPIFNIRLHWVYPFFMALLIFCISLIIAKIFKKKFTIDKQYKEILYISISIICSCLLSLKVILGGIINPELPNQKWDSAFHLNAITSIMHTGNASPLHISDFLINATETFYPPLFHAIVAEVAHMSSANVIVAFNIVSAVICSVLWPASCLFLTYVMFGLNKLYVFPLCASILFANGFMAYPYRFFTFGGLFSNLLSISVLPFFIGFFLLFCKKDNNIKEISSLAACLGLASTTFIMFLAQPNSNFFAFFICIPIACSHIVFLIRSKKYKYANIFILLFIVSLIIFYCSLKFVSSSAQWPPTKTIFEGFGDWLTNATPWSGEKQPITFYKTSYLLSFLSIAGLYYSVKNSQYRWMAYSWLILGFIFVVCIGFPDNTFRKLTTGFFFADIYRVIGVQTVLSVQLSTIGLIQLFDSIQKKLISVMPNFHFSLNSIFKLAIFKIAFIISATLIIYFAGPQWAIGQMKKNAYELSFTNGVLDEDKLALMNDIRNIVPKNEKIIAMPFNGTPLIYTYTHRELIFPAMAGFLNEDKKLLAQSFKYIQNNSKVCNLIRDLNVTYAVDFGLLTIDGRDHFDFDGLKDLTDTPGLHLVAEHGEAKLYSILPCNVDKSSSGG